MKKLINIIVFTALSTMLCAGGAPTPYYSIDDANWLVNSTWSSTSGGATCLCVPSITGAKEDIYIESNVFLVSDLTLGSQTTLVIRSGDTLDITGNVVFSNGCVLDVEPGGVFKITGNVTNNNNSDDVNIDGKIMIDGNFSGGTGSAIIGTGTFTTTGTATTTGTGSVFGSTGDCDTGPCLGTPASPLPIELVSFEAHLNIDQVDLKWITASELNNDYFTIERSTDGVNFVTVFKVEGAGTTTHEMEYFEIDYSPIVGVVYYRLKQTDFDGKYTYSGLVPVEYTGTDRPGTALFGPEAEAGIKIWPTVCSGDEPVNVEVSGYDPEHEVLVIVRDIAGREYYSKVLITDMDGHLVTACDPSQTLPVGTYLVTGSDQNHLYSKKLIVK